MILKLYYGFFLELVLFCIIPVRLFFFSSSFFSFFYPVHFSNYIIQQIEIYINAVILATDQANARSILLYQTNLDKITQLTSHSAIAVSGPNCDMANFTEYIHKNLQLYELANDGIRLSTHAQAHFCRNELARAIRQGPYQVNALLGGYDPEPASEATEDSKEEGTGSSSLYYLDYFGTLHKLKYGCQGYADYFCLGIMDRDYKANVADMTKQDAIDLVYKCIKEMKVRFLLNQSNFIIKCIDSNGISVVSADSDPLDN